MKTKTDKKEQTFLHRTRNIYNGHKHRAIRDNAALDYTLGKLREVFRSIIANRTPCPTCKRILVTANISADHEIPTSRGGKHEFWNLAFICRPCNQAKGSMTMAEFQALIATLQEPETRKNTLSRLRAGNRFYGKK